MSQSEFAKIVGVSGSLIALYETGQRTPSLKMAKRIARDVYKRQRQGRCRHMEAVDIAREQTRQGIMSGSSTDSEISTNQLLSERQNTETTSEIHNVNRVYVDDDFFYTENTEAFARDMERLQNEAIPYYYENALNGSDLSLIHI